MRSAVEISPRPDQTQMGTTALSEMSRPRSRRTGLESHFEALIWKYRLITLVPVVMSLLGSLSCFVIGTYAELSVLSRIFQGRFTLSLIHI